MNAKTQIIVVVSFAIGFTFGLITADHRQGQRELQKFCGKWNEETQGHDWVPDYMCEGTEEHWMER